MFIEFLVIERQPAANIYQCVFLAAHRATIAVRAKFLQDFSHGDFLVTPLTLLDKESVFDRSGGIEKDADAVLLREPANGFEIGHRNWLAAGHIHRSGQANIGYFPSANFFDELFQRVEIDIALERMLRRRVVRFRNHHIHKRAAR